MSNYQKSIYILNKFSQNIVYRFGDKVKEVTLDDFLRDNPSFTKENFDSYKKISDEMFHDEDNSDNYFYKKKLSINTMDESKFTRVESRLDEMIAEEEKQELLEITYQILQYGKITKIQKRRFLLYINGSSTRQIAQSEEVSQMAIWKSINAINKKIKNIFKK